MTEADLSLQLSNAIMLATAAHKGQFDKAGEPYILHPLRVMMKMKNDTDRIVAVLHDTVEDCEGVNIQMIANRFGDMIAEAVAALTRREGEAYPSFIKRCAGNPIALRVKLADIADNLDEDRAASLPDSLRDRYLKARYILQSAASPAYF